MHEVTDVAVGVAQEPFGPAGRQGPHRDAQVGVVEERHGEVAGWNRDGARVERMGLERPGERGPTGRRVQAVEVARAAAEAFAAVLLFDGAGRQVGVRLAGCGAADPLGGRAVGHGQPRSLAGFGHSYRSR
jgi:hypothetical protein